MRLGGWFLALTVVVLLACGPLPRYLPPGWRPDLFVILVTFVALRAEPGQAADALTLCWMTGLAKDLLSAGPVGEYALLYLAAGAAFLRVRPALGARSAAAGAALAWAAALFTECVAAWAVGREGGRLWTMPGAFRGVLSASLVTACVAWPSFWCLDHLLRRGSRGRRLKAAYDEVEGAA